MAATTFTNPIMAAGIAGLQRLYADRAVTPVEATDAYLSRIRGLDGALGAFVHVDAEGAHAAALASAERWRQGKALSPIDGAPIAVKANIAVKGFPWHAGIEAYRGRIAEEDAPCIQALRAAGAVIIGLTNMHEGAFGATTDNPAFGRTHNPWRHGTTAGGSSGGSGAAVAAGLCAGALGSDTLGSVRIPASLTGTYGHKPTQGLISAEGVVPMSWTLDHVGVHARSAEDCAHLLAGAVSADVDLAGEITRPADMEALAAAPLAVLDLSGLGAVAPAVAAATEAAVARGRAMGLEIEPLRLEGYDWLGVIRDGVLVSAAESLVEHEADLAAGGDGFSEIYRQTLAIGEHAAAPALAKAYRSLAEAAAAVREQLTPFAGLVLPTTPTQAEPFETAASAGVALLTPLANVLGLPATAFPTGFHGGLPLSTQVIAWEDDTALGLAGMLGEPFVAPDSYRG
jgi:aspartyl-tRNA(Asn)/glutamyl-tRNA(Gln) amidotransferase subunit A